MIHRKETFLKNTLPLFQQRYLTRDMLLFDIETTGLSPAKDQIYCIGCGYLSGEEFVIELFFAENQTQEKPVLDAFFRLLSSRRTIITFNGNTFDIPFVRKRATFYGFTGSEDSGSFRSCGSTLSENLTFIDLYREATGMKSLLRLPSYRQKTVEQFLGCNREDKYDGGQLIDIYHQYAADQDQQLLSLLLLHNFEDVRGMLDLLGILSYHQLRDGQFEISGTFTDSSAEHHCCTDASGTTCSSYYNMRFCTEYPLPQTIHLPGQDFSLILNRNGGLIRFPVCHGLLKHFFPDCENYYYLPDEDYAVHKSIGSFVDSSHRRKATKKTCYTKKECDYITVPSRCANGYLRKTYQDKNNYLTLPAAAEKIKPFLKEHFNDNLF